MDALHLIRAAAEFADQVERDAHEAVAGQVKRAESSIAEKQRELSKQETRVDQLDREAKTKRDERLATARKEAEDIVARAEREAKEKVREAEASAARLLEQARHQATELTNSARAEMDRALEWARAEASEMHNRAREGAEKVLSAAGLSGDALQKVVESVVGSLKGEGEGRPSKGSAGESGSGGTSSS
jgi:cell division septum initiation protein DivIVA